MNAPILDIHKILKKLPHRYPLLLVDRVVEFEKDKRIKALKNVTINEPFFAGHFPGRPVMPGVLMLEALAQASALLSFESSGQELGDDMVVYFVGLDGARFLRTTARHHIGRCHTGVPFDSPAHLAFSTGANNCQITNNDDETSITNDGHGKRVGTRESNNE